MCAPAQAAKNSVLTDPHAPANFRVLGGLTQRVLDTPVAGVGHTHTSDIHTNESGGHAHASVRHTHASPQTSALHHIQAAKNSVLTDPHAPAKFRVLGGLTQFAPFAEAFQVRKYSRARFHVHAVLYQGRSV